MTEFLSLGVAICLVERKLFIWTIYSQFKTVTICRIKTVLEGVLAKYPKRTLLPIECCN